MTPHSTLTRVCWLAQCSGLVAVLTLVGCNEDLTEAGPNTPVAAVAVDEVPPLLPGGTVQLKARAVGAKGEVLLGRTIIFAGTDDMVATVSSSGLVTAIKPGTLAVRASVDAQSGIRELTVNYPVPIITSITPASVLTLTTGPITVRGTGFYPGTVVLLGIVAKAITFISDHELRINLTGADVAAAGTRAITAFNPTPGGGASASAFLLIQTPIACRLFTPLTLGSAVTGSLVGPGCTTGTVFYHDSFSFTTTVPTAIVFTLTSSLFDPALLLTDTNSIGTQFAFGSATRPNPGRIRVMIPAGTFGVIPGSANSGAVGSYSLASTTSAQPEITNCDTWYVVPPINLNQTVTSEDCAYNFSNGPAYWDDYSIFLRAGQTVTATVESSAFNAFLYAFTGQAEFYEETKGSGTAKISFTANKDGVYVISAGPVEVKVTGSYKLQIQ